MVTPMFVIKVKLPSAGGYASCPSGDTEYEEAYNKAIREAMPDGFAPVKPRLNEAWPRDSSGLTWMPVALVHPQDSNGELAAFASMRAVIADYQKLLAEVVDLAGRFKAGRHAAHFSLPEADKPK